MDSKEMKGKITQEMIKNIKNTACAVGGPMKEGQKAESNDKPATPQAVVTKPQSNLPEAKSTVVKSIIPIVVPTTPK